MHVSVTDRLEILRLEAKLQELLDKIKESQEDIGRQEQAKAELETKQQTVQGQYEEVLLRIANSGYSALEQKLGNVNEMLEHLQLSRAKWQRTAAGLAAWKSKDVTPNQTLWDIEKFETVALDEETLKRLQTSLVQIREELGEDLKDAEAKLRVIKKEEKDAREELKELKQGRKAYPKEVEEAKYELRTRLQERCGRLVPVQILADLLDVRDEKWHNAIEGYMGNNKLLLVVEPNYVKDAMEIYQGMDKKRFSRAAVLDTEKVLSSDKKAKAGSLAEEVLAKEEYVRAYIDFFLGNVIKCDGIDELREQTIGITADCMLYQGYRLQHINPESYTRRAYIGETSMRQRIRRLEERCDALQQERLPLQEMKEEIQRVLTLEALSQPAEEYMSWKKEIDEIQKKEREKRQIQEEMKKLQDGEVSALKAQKEDLLWQQEGNELLHEMNRQIFYECLNDQIPNENVKALKESFAYHYRNEAETKGRLKYSVSEIKRMSQAADTEEVMYSSVSMEKEKRIPSFIKKTEKISAASKGTIIHKVFELLDFSKDYTMKSLNEDIERWISLGKLKKEYEKVIYRKEILALTRSELGKRMKEAAQKKLLYKERQFVTGIPFSDMNKDAKTDDFVVVQGIIDVYFEEEDKIILVDYKTDRVREGEEDILIRRYRAQMESYQQALEKITGKCVKEIYIYSVTLQKTIPVHV